MIADSRWICFHTDGSFATKLDNAHVIYNPPSFDVSDPCGPPPNDVFRLLNVARIDPGHKGQDLLLDVLALPKWRQRDVQLQIAGGGNRKWLELLIACKGLTNVTLLGHVNDLKAVWEKTTFGIFPSRYEGIPLALVEGMALGRAVIATDVAGHREWIDHGMNGFLAAGASISCIDDALEQAWIRRDDACAFGMNALQFATELLIPPPSHIIAEVIINENHFKN